MCREAKLTSKSVDSSIERFTLAVRVVAHGEGDDAVWTWGLKFEGLRVPDVSAGSRRAERRAPFLRIYEALSASFHLFPSRHP